VERASPRSIGVPVKANSRSDPWQGVANAIGIAALIGAGVGAASALMYARRHSAGQEGEIDALERRVGAVEQLGERVAQLEARVGAAAAAEPGGNA
jgi:hypothetical protein